MPIPKRSRKHTLSDQELAILDCLLLMPAPRDSLHWVLQLGAPYVRFNDHAEILQAVEQLHQAACVGIELPENTWVLTDAGLQIWSDERNPPWDRWLKTEITLDKQRSIESWRIVGGSRNVVLDYMEIMQQHGALARPLDRIAMGNERRYNHPCVTCDFHAQARFSHVRVPKALQSWWTGGKDLYTQ